MSRAPGVPAGVELPQPTPQYDAANERETRRLLMQALRRLPDYSTLMGQPANLSALAGLTGAADNVPYFTGAGAMALASLTAYGRTLIACANAAAARTALGLQPLAVLALPSDATQFANGVGAFAQVKGSDLSMSDVTTNNVSTSAHGFAPKLSGSATQYLDGTGAWSTPAGSGGGSNPLNTPSNLGRLTTIFPPLGSAASNFTTVGDSGSATNGTAGGSGGSAGIGVTALGQSGLAQNATGYQLGYSPLLKFSLNLVAVTNVRAWVGFSDLAANTVAGTATPTGNFVMFRFDTSAGDTHWKCCTRDNVTTNVVDSGVAPVANTSVFLAIDCDPVAGAAKFYINGVLVATITTHLPGSTTNMRWLMVGNTLSVSQQIIYFGGTILCRAI